MTDLRRLLAWGGVVWLAVGVFVAPRAEVDLDSLITETQQQTPDPDRLALVWWIPEEFWRATVGADPSTRPEDLEELLAVLRPYLVVAALDGTLGPIGGATFVSEAELRESLRVLDSHGRDLAPLPTERISGDARNLSAFLRPLLTNLMGPVGENLHFFFFPATTAEGVPIADPLAAGSFAVRLGGDSFAWDLPLGSLLPPKRCPLDGRELSGAWEFCPWHGRKLEPGAPPEPPSRAASSR